MALLRAMLKGRSDQAQAALDAGADPNAALPDIASAKRPSGEWLMPIILASAQRSGALCELLLKAGARPSLSDTRPLSSPLYQAFFCDSPRSALALLRAGAPVEHPGNRDSHGVGLLHKALTHPKWRPFIPALLAFGANPNAQDDRGATPLHTLASLHMTLRPECLRGNRLCAARLVRAGADLGLRDALGFTPLGVAISYSQPEATATLLALGSRWEGCMPPEQREAFARPHAAAPGLDPDSLMGRALACQRLVLKAMAQREREAIHAGLPKRGARKATQAL